LKAEVKIAETRAKDIQFGQAADIDTRNGHIPGRVVRIDPAVQNGTVTVDVALEGELPKSVRTDLSVDGTIQLEHLENVVHVGRPVFAQEHGTITLFSIGGEWNPCGARPGKTRQEFGHLSEILEGLKPGDQVILSDMSAWDGYDRSGCSDRPL
jgi:HlyD family secretion protein